MFSISCTVSQQLESQALKGRPLELRIERTHILPGASNALCPRY
jgi:hypothetical protein